jgi:hypothetical protein
MNNLPKTLLRTGALFAVSVGLAIAAQAAPNPKAGDHPNPKASAPHPGDAHSAEGKAKADANRDAAQEKAALERYDANHNGKLDPDEIAAMEAAKDKPADKKKGKGKR